MANPNTAFGLSFRQHDNRLMQHILRAYSKLPSNPNVRHEVYIALVMLEKHLPVDEARGITKWLGSGGVLSAFPGPDGASGPPVNGDLRPVVETPFRPVAMGEPVAEVLDEEDIAEDDDRDTDDEADYVPDDPTRPENTVRDAEWAETNHAGFSDDMNLDVDNDYGNPDDVDSDANARPLNDQNTGAGKVEPDPDLKECIICSESYGPDRFFNSWMVTSRCTEHEDYACCKRCIKDSIQAALKEGELRRIVCPLCPAPMSREEIEKYSTKEMFTRYEYLILMSTPGLVMCLGPSCGFGQIHEPATGEPVMTCNACNFKTCVFHKLPWHEGFTCEEFDCDESQIERLEADEATAKLLSQNSKICPTCNQGVTKTDGCDHLQCRCGEEWCFVCLASWENIIRIGGTAHARHCTYHPDKIRLHSSQAARTNQQMAELVHGGPVSEALEKARFERNKKIREKMRPLAAEAAERRMLAMAMSREEKPVEKKRKLKLAPAWEEQR